MDELRRESQIDNTSSETRDSHKVTRRTTKGASSLMKKTYVAERFKGRNIR